MSALWYFTVLRWRQGVFSQYCAGTCDLYHGYQKPNHFVAFASYRNADIYIKRPKKQDILKIVYNRVAYDDLHLRSIPWLPLWQSLWISNGIKAVGWTQAVAWQVLICLREINALKPCEWLRKIQSDCWWQNYAHHYHYRYEWDKISRRKIK